MEFFNFDKNKTYLFTLRVKIKNFEPTLKEFKSVILTNILDFSLEACSMIYLDPLTIKSATIILQTS